MKFTNALALLLVATAAHAQQPQTTVEVDPQIRYTPAQGKIMKVDVAPHFVTTIRVPDPVNSVVVGDPGVFQVEHSEHEPTLVFIKTLVTSKATTNLLISTVSGRQISILLMSNGEGAGAGRKVDFVLQYKPAGGFMVEQQAVPFAVVGEATTLPKIAANGTSSSGQVLPVSLVDSAHGDAAHETSSESKSDALDALLKRQEQAPLPVMYGEHPEGEQTSKADRLRTGISNVIDGGQQVIVAFSVINTSKHAILLMPPQVQLGGKTKSGKIIKHQKWSTAEQLPILDFRLNRRRIGPGERADGIVAFERPPYKQSSETLFLQVAESGAVDRPALAPVGFGVSTTAQERISANGPRGN